MVEKEDPELPSSHAHAETTSACITPLPENNLKTGRMDLPQLVIERRPLWKEEVGWKRIGRVEM